MSKVPHPVSHKFKQNYNNSKRKKSRLSYRTILLNVDDIEIRKRYQHQNNNNHSKKKKVSFHCICNSMTKKRKSTPSTKQDTIQYTENETLM
mmetsp:Transcript_34474/g.35061  ORF Transcript_34474/g.35061 Transcript_34474/m.35061 type:complete len:92 (+) Transcript_34474:578-853(+)